MPAPIPPDLQPDILVRLPVKSLLRFQCVSRSWKSLISSSGFISKHNKITDNYHHLLHWYNYVEIGPYEFNDSFTEFRSAEFPSQVKSNGYSFVLDCEGLILFAGKYEHCILWNPAVRKSMTLPRPCIEVLKTNYPVFGFGFDHGNNYYKVLRIVCNNVFSLFTPSPPLKAEFYDLRTGFWKTVRVDEDFGYLIKCQTQSFVNGASHWVGYSAPPRGLNPLPDRAVVVFDMCDEEFRLMKLPDSLSGALPRDVCLGVSGGLLSLVDYDRQPEGILTCSVWLLKEYGVAESWTMCATIDLSDWGQIRRGLFSFRNNEEIVFVTGRKKLALFDLKTQRITALGMEIGGCWPIMNTYKESLVLLNEDRSASENRFCSKKRMGLAGPRGLLRKVPKKK